MSSIEQKIEADNKDQSQVTRDYRLEIEEELNQVCGEVLVSLFSVCVCVCK